MEEENINVFDLVLNTLNRDDLWFTQKTDPTYQEASSYYELDEFGDPTEKTVKKIEKEVNSLIGDGAVDVADAVELWKNDQITEFRLDFKDNLVTKFEPKPIVDNIEAFVNPVQCPQSKKIEGKNQDSELIKFKKQLQIKENITEAKDVLDTKRYYNYLKAELEKRYNDYCYENDDDIEFQDWLDEYGDMEVEDIEDEYLSNLEETKTKKTEEFWEDDKVYKYKDIDIQLSISDRGKKLYQILNNQKPFSIPYFSTLSAAKKYIDDNNLESYKKNQENKEVKVEDVDYDRYIEDEKALAEQYKDRIKNQITPEIKNAFNDLSDILDEGGDTEEYDGFYFPEKAITIVELADKSYHLNSAMDLTVSNILNMVGNNETIEDAIDELFEDYDANSAYSWADNFITVLGKLDFDLQKEDERAYTFEVSLPDCDPLMFTNDWTEDAAIKEYMENEGVQSRYTVDDIDVTYFDEPIPVEESKKVEASNYISKYDEIDDMIDLLVSTPQEKVWLYNEFNPDAPIDKYDETTEDLFREWLDNAKVERYTELRAYLDEQQKELDDYADELDGMYENKSFGRALRELKTEVKSDKTELTPEQKANKIANVGSLVGRAKYPFQLSAVVHTLSFIDQDLSNKLRQQYNPSTIRQDGMEEARSGIARMIYDETGVDVLAPNMEFATEGKNVNFNNCTKDKKEENYQRRLEEVNNKSANTIKDILGSEGFDAESNAGKIVLRTQDLFTALSDLGLDVDVTFDNGDSTSTIQLGTAGGKVVITINDPEKPLKAFMSGNVELTGDSLEKFQSIEDRIKTV